MVRTPTTGINFDDDEEMIGISGTHGNNHDGYDLISSLCFVTTKKKYETVGKESYTSFAGSWEVGRFEGFYGRCGWSSGEFKFIIFIIGLKLYLYMILDLRYDCKCELEMKLNTLCDKAKEILMEEHNVQVGQLTEKFNKFHYAELNLFSEVEIEGRSNCWCLVSPYQVVVAIDLSRTQKIGRMIKSSFYAFQIQECYLLYAKKEANELKVPTYDHLSKVVTTGPSCRGTS
ncbi:jacalin-like lectin domain-containing protein [Artemisia annua]|uniref:Jacalin-like lectin domain-containing protein n=1 Tax=Artemisia annua TaxID=35608 RepID=A0A2U1M4U8_ARTAN|nr:jacalin-like lectin domain-containing protein [Artemisia annua]